MKNQLCLRKATSDESGHNISRHQDTSINCKWDFCFQYGIKTIQILTFLSISSYYCNTSMTWLNDFIVEWDDVSCLCFDTSSQADGYLGWAPKLTLFTVSNIYFAFWRFKFDHILFKCKFQSLSLVKITAGSMESHYFEVREASGEVFNCFA